MIFARYFIMRPFKYLVLFLAILILCPERTNAETRMIEYPPFDWQSHVFQDVGVLDPNVKYKNKAEVPDDRSKIRKIFSSEYSGEGYYTFACFEYGDDDKGGNDEVNPAGNYCYDRHFVEFDYQASAAMALTRRAKPEVPGDLDMILEYFGKGIRYWQINTWLYNLGNYTKNDRTFFAPYNVLVGSDFATGTTKIELTNDGVYATRMKGVVVGNDNVILEDIKKSRSLHGCEAHGDCEPRMSKNTDGWHTYDTLIFRGYDTSDKKVNASTFLDHNSDFCNEPLYDEVKLSDDKYKDLCRLRAALHLQNANEIDKMLDADIKGKYERNKKITDYIENPDDNFQDKHGVLTFSFQESNETKPLVDEPFVKGNVHLFFENMLIRLHLKHDKEFEPFYKNLPQGEVWGDLSQWGLPLDKEWSHGLKNGFYAQGSSPDVFLTNSKIMAVKSKKIIKTKYLTTREENVNTEQNKKFAQLATAPINENERGIIAVAPAIREKLPDFLLIRRIIYPESVGLENFDTSAAPSRSLPDIGGLDNGIGIEFSDKVLENLDLFLFEQESTNGIRFFRPYKDDNTNKFGETDIFRVSPMKLESAPNFEYGIQIKRKVVKEDKTIEYKGDILLLKTNVDKRYYKIKYAECLDHNCKKYKEAVNEIEGPGSGFAVNVQTLDSGFDGVNKLEDVDVTRPHYQVVVNQHGTRLRPLPSLNNYYDAKGEKKELKGESLDCYISRKASPDVKETIDGEEVSKINSKIYSICEFPTDKAKIDLVVMDNKDTGAEADTQGTNFKYELAFKPVYGEPVGGKQPVIFEWANDVGRKPDNIGQLVDAVDSQDPNKIQMYGLVVGENGLEDYYYKINFKTEKDIDSRSINIYADKSLRDTSAINNFGNQITHVFFDNSLVGMINGSSFTDNNSTDFYKDDIFTTKWSEMKRFYDDKGREVKFKVVRDLGNKNDREPVITIGYIKNSLIELIDPFVSEEGASESCDGSMYCTLENFIETDEYKDANQAELEPLSKMECKGGYDSVDYLCLASSTSDWNFTNYSEKCVKTETFKTELNNGTSGNTDVLTELLKLPLESEGKTTHLYQWCMPKYEFNGVLYNREICEINKKVIIDDNNYTCELCEGNSVPDETKETCVECEEGKIADPSDGTCKDAEEIVVPPETDDKCTKGVEIIISNTCSCPSGSKRVENSDKSKFMCLSCEEGFEPNPDDFGKCISTTDLELIRKMKECLKLAPLMEWKDNVCVFTNKATTLTCPSNAFIVTDRNKDCVCADGTSPVIDSINGSGQCGKTDLNVVNKNEGGGCSIGSDKVNSILPLFFTFILLISKKRKYFRL